MKKLLSAFVIAAFGSMTTGVSLAQTSSGIAPTVAAAGETPKADRPAKKAKKGKKGTKKSTPRGEKKATPSGAKK